MRALISSILLLLVLQGCSMLPYEEDFACKLGEYGRCVDSEGAYKMAKTGVKQGKKITPDGSIEDIDGAKIDDKDTFKTKNNAYIDYKNEEYKTLRGLLSEPETPMVKPPEVVRVLIINYKTKKKGHPLFMNRYVYFFGSEPTWVLAQDKKDKKYDSSIWAH